ncbi:hypothetical protein BZG02_12050 [Labilibaculum filiforme]|uniref:DUF5017 domain-containing protein n=1 Tax=Labilibaculum filiforme TaxID=1940526 RepID=A0A2N3HWN3_9BACT|nr:hypothetical protein [Labilibaculum filiforme]PKQ62457.1 hypothetical protein BZG02_12050 [Labilibaculum filiforme]
MKKILYIVSLFALVFAGCDPMEDIYKDVDKLSNDNNVHSLEYTLTADDYSDIGGDPKKYESFSAYAPATDYLPEFLDGKYPTLDVSSSVKVTYDFYRGSLNYLGDYLDYLEVLAAIDSYTLTTADYDSMGTDQGQPGKYNNFDSGIKASDYLPNFLLAKYPNAIENDELAVTYKFYNGSANVDITEFWVFDGSVWTKSDKVAPELAEGVTLYELVADDYDSMGTPGKYNNFSSSDAPENYLSTFLGVKFPYASEGDKFLVLYKYYAGGGVTETRAKEYTLTDGTWMEYTSTVAKTDQYLKTANGWLFDPTVLYTMGADDYLMIVNYVKDNVGAEYLDSYGTAEAYYGSNSYYVEFNIGSGNYDASFATWQDAVTAGVKAYLPLKFPEAVAQVDGVDVNYVITFAGYESSMVDYTITFKCTKSGPNPEFEYVEGPTVK